MNLSVNPAPQTYEMLSGNSESSGILSELSESPSVMDNSELIGEVLKALSGEIDSLPASQKIDQTHEWVAGNNSSQSQQIPTKDCVLSTAVLDLNEQESTQNQDLHLQFPEAVNSRALGLFWNFVSQNGLQSNGISALHESGLYYECRPFEEEGTNLRLCFHPQLMPGMNNTFWCQDCHSSFYSGLPSNRSAAQNETELANLIESETITTNSPDNENLLSLTSEDCRPSTSATAFSILQTSLERTTTKTNRMSRKNCLVTCLLYSGFMYQPITPLTENDQITKERKKWLTCICMKLGLERIELPEICLKQMFPFCSGQEGCQEILDEFVKLMYPYSDVNVNEKRRQKMLFQLETTIKNKVVDRVRSISYKRKPDRFSVEAENRKFMEFREMIINTMEDFRTLSEEVHKLTPIPFIGNGTASLESLFKLPITKPCFVIITRMDPKFLEKYAGQRKDRTGVQDEATSRALILRNPTASIKLSGNKKPFTTTWTKDTGISHHVCNRCPYSVDNHLPRMKSHVKLHDSGIGIICKYCQMLVESSRLLRFHEKVHHNISHKTPAVERKTFSKCEHCGALLGKKDEEAHLNFHRKGTGKDCEQCGWRVKYLPPHIKRWHCEDPKQQVQVKLWKSRVRATVSVVDGLNNEQSTKSHSSTSNGESSVPKRNLRISAKKSQQAHVYSSDSSEVDDDDSEYEPGRN